jgi:DNA-binding CsgD family transcriptional regulator
VEKHLRGEVRGLPLTQREHDFLYQRAIEGSRKDAARVTGTNTNTAHHLMASIFEKLGVEDLVSAFWAMGWLHPLPYGVSKAEVRHEKLQEGNHTEQDFWKRMDDATKDLEDEP